MWNGRSAPSGCARRELLRYSSPRTSISIALASKVDKLFTCQQRLLHYIQSPSTTACQPAGGQTSHLAFTSHPPLASHTPPHSLSHMNAHNNDRHPVYCHAKYPFSSMDRTAQSQNSDCQTPFPWIYLASSKSFAPISFSCPVACQDCHNVVGSKTVRKGLYSECLFLRLSVRLSFFAVSLSLIYGQVI